MRAWCVTVENREEAFYRDGTDRIACKFVLSEARTLKMDVEAFEAVIARELIYAVRKVKAEMIMKGMEP